MVQNWNWNLWNWNWNCNYELGPELELELQPPELKKNWNCNSGIGPNPAQHSEDTPRFVEACCFMNTAIKLPCCLLFSVLVNSVELPYRNQERTGSRLHRQTDGHGETNIPPNKHDTSSPYEAPTHLNLNGFNQY